MPVIPVITIDGPSGAGKGTLARLLAQHLGWHILDSGAIYRLMALAAQQAKLVICSADLSGLNPKELDVLKLNLSQLEEKDWYPFINLARHLDIAFTIQNHQVTYWLNGVDQSHNIRTEACGNLASQLAQIPALRQALLSRQRACKQYPGLVADGRDMGTVVFPEARIKIFLTASHQERLRRRYDELQQRGLAVSMDDLAKNFSERDQRDQARAIAPLQPAVDAWVIDTTGLSAEQVFHQVLGILAKA